MGVTAHPTAEWVADQLPEACGWDQAPTYLLRDRDRVYGQAFTRGIRAMGIRDRPTSPRSPWQKSLCRTADRLDPTEMRRSYRGLRRAAPSSRVAIVHEPLQRSANTSVVRQRCSGITCSSCRRPHSSEADSRRSPPPVRPDLICGRERARTSRRFAASRGCMGDVGCWL